MAAHLLAPVANINTFLLQTKVHDTLFPFALLPTLHALRISFLHNALKAKARSQHALNDVKQGGEAPPSTTWAYDIAGFLVMCWGGGFLVSAILGQTPVQLLSIYPLLNYVGVHLFVTFLLHFVITEPTAKFLDTALILIDGSTRTHAVIMSITMAATSPVGAVQNSAFLQIICGTLGATGGGQLGATLSVYSPHGWTLQTPPVLRARSLVEVIDVLASIAVSLLFCITTLSHPSYAPVLARIHNTKGKPLLSAVGARAASTLLFACAFAYRSTALHWMPASVTVGTASQKQRGLNGVEANGATDKPTSSAMRTRRSDAIEKAN